MQSEKENFDFRKHNIIKIPISKSQPKYFSEDKMTVKDEEKRVPLQTLTNKTEINTQILNKKIHDIPSHKDARHVTVRNKSENDNLDWDLLIFEENIPIIVISDDEDKQTSSKVNPSTSQRVTPADGSALENKAVKNIKKSLKRHHSRELQVADDRKDEYEKASKKFRTERIYDRINPPNEVSKRDAKKLLNDYSIDVFTYLMSLEKKIVHLPRVNDTTRACIVNWLMKINGPNGNPATLQTACWYLDILLSSYDVILENLQLIATACYWLSQKVHGPVMSSVFLVKMVKGAFTVRDLVDTERCILRCMNFPSVKVIPHDYVTYFALCSDNDSPGEVEVAASFIVKAGLLVKPALACEYPSVIAAAAVKNAVLLLKKKRLMTNLLVNFIFRKAVEKTGNLNGICSAQRSAIRTVASPKYKYRACFEHYSVPPFYIAKKLATAAFKLYYEIRGCHSVLSY